MRLYTFSLARLTLFLVASAVSLISLSSVSAFAQLQSEYLHQPVLSTRVMGMGGAFTAVADDYNALYYNPAGLARLDHNQFVAEIYAGLTPSILSFETQLSGAGNNPTSIQNVLANNFGDHFSSRVGLGGTWVGPHWGIGFQPVDLSLELDIHGTAGVTLGVEAFQDTLLQYGHGWSFGENNSLSVGIAPKAVYRASIQQDLTIFNIISSGSGGSIFQPSEANEGLFVDFDLGAMYTFQIPDDGWFKWLKNAKPTVAFAVRNVLDLQTPADFHLYSSQSSAYPAQLQRRFDVGTNFVLPEFWVFKPHFMIDFRDLGTAQASFIKCSHVGAELLWKAFGWLNGGYRVGLSEGYFTAGLSAELGVFLLDLAAYSEEIGTTSDPRQSTRYMAQLSVDI